MAEAYTRKQKEDLRNLFKIKDKDGTGWLETDELENCLILMGLCPTADDLEFITKTFDNNGDGRIQISELVDNVHVLYAHSMNSEELMKAFKLFDKKGRGYIRYTELLKILCHDGFMPVDDARSLLTYLSKHFDHNGDGKYSYAEFVEVFLSERFQEEVVSKWTEKQ